jgi:hypothetical protein
MDGAGLDEPRHVTAQSTFSMSPGFQLLLIAASVGA